MRALDILAGCDWVACEDTRVTGQLLHFYGLSKKLIAYHEHNAAKQRPVLRDRLQAGQTGALVSDAGLPLIADPGFKLVQDCVTDGLYVTALPGANAGLTALQLSALPPAPHLFLGFPPPKRTARRAFFGQWGEVTATLIYYEGVSRLGSSLQDALATLGERPAAVGRELTKLYEETRRAPLSELAAYYAEHGPPKGECVVVIGPPANKENVRWPEDRLCRELEALQAQGLGRKEAAARLADPSGWKKRDIYNLDGGKKP